MKYKVVPYTRLLVSFTPLAPHRLTHYFDSLDDAIADAAKWAGVMRRGWQYRVFETCGCSHSKHEREVARFFG